MAEITGGDLLVEALHRGGVDTVFGLPGVQLDAAFDALARRSDSFRVVHTRHEQATSYMADGFARAGGGIGCCLVVPGPGLLNAMSGLATAYACSSRVICVAGQVRSTSIDQGLGLLHEIPHQLEVARSVAKWAGRAMAPEEIPALVAEAFRQLCSGRPRPVVVEVPPDVLEARARSFRGPVAEPGRQAPPPHLDETSIVQAAELMARAARPLIWAGGGVLAAEAWAELVALAERLQAPVLTTANAKGAISARHRLAFESPAAPRLLAQADAILAVGTRLARSGGGRWELGIEQALIRIDADGEQLARAPTPRLAIEADARQALAALLAALPGGPGSQGWRGLDELRLEVAAKVAAVEPQASLAAAIRAELPDDGILVNGMTQVGYWSRLGFSVYEPRTFLGPGYQGTLGFELPTGLGAQLAQPGRKVVIVVGDGGLLFNVQELATAVQQRINAVTVVFNDAAYGNVKRIQRQRFGRLIASDLHNPDFVRLADAFGLRGLRASGPAQLARALRTALSAEEPALIEVPVGEMGDPWPLILGTV